jgi:hypothetical protein
MGANGQLHTWVPLLTKHVTFGLNPNKPYFTPLYKHLKTFLGALLPKRKIFAFSSQLSGSIHVKAGNRSSFPNVSTLIILRQSK